jgi:hypothetical protein
LADIQNWRILVLLDNKTRFPTLARKRIQETSGMLLYYGLGANILFALARVSKSLGLQYNTGYAVHPIDFVILSINYAFMSASILPFA